MKKIIALVLVFVCLLFAVGCKEENPAIAKVKAAYQNGMPTRIVVDSETNFDGTKVKSQADITMGSYQGQHKRWDNIRHCAEYKTCNLHMTGSAVQSRANLSAVYSTYAICQLKRESRIFFSTRGSSVYMRSTPISRNRFISAGSLTVHTPTFIPAS